MTMIRWNTMLALGAAGLLAAGCAAKPAEETTATEPVAESAPMAAAFDQSLLASPGAKPILLSSEVMPDGGQLEQGTLVTGSGGWAVHGELDGVAWRYGSSDAGQLRVAGEPGTEWQYIQVQQSWGVQCRAEPGSGDAGAGRTPCVILRLASVEPGTMATGGLALDEHVTCVRAANPNAPATISVDGAAAVSLPQPSLCLSGADADAVQNAMMAGQTVTIEAGFYPNGSQTMSFPTHGLKQALAMRGWIVAQYKAGKLNAPE
jgi:hypothetical protein